MLPFQSFRSLYLFITFSLLIAPLPLPLMAQEIIVEKIDSIKPLHCLLDLIRSINLLEEQKDPQQEAFAELFDEESSIVTHNEILSFLEYANDYIEKNSHTLNDAEIEKIKTLISAVLEQIQDNYIIGNETSMPLYRVMKVDEKAWFEKHIHAKKGIHIKGRMRVGKTAKFRKNARVKHKLFADQGIFNKTTTSDAVAEKLTVLSCIDSICIDNLSVANATIQNINYGNNVWQLDDMVEQVAYNTSVLDIVMNNMPWDGNLIEDTQLATIVSPGKVANSATTGTSLDIPNTLVERNESGDFQTNNIDIEQSVRYWDNAEGYAAIQAPSDLSTNYILSLPIELPLQNQVLGVNLSAPSQIPFATPIQLEWVDQQTRTTPTENRTIYVTINGNDSTGNGSFDTPYGSVSKAIDVANTIASDLNPIAIIISDGIYVEDNSLAPLSVTAHGISIVGNSANGVIIMPSAPGNDLLSAIAPVQIRNITFQSSDQLARGIILSAPGLSVFENVYTYNFLVGIDCLGSIVNSYGFNNCLFINNATALKIENTYVECNACTFFGSSSLTGPAENTGIAVTGANSNVIISGGIIGICTTGFILENNAIAEINGVSFRLNQFDVIQTGPSNLTLSSCLFKRTDNSSDIDIQISGVGAQTEIISCEFDGRNTAGVTQGTALLVSDDAIVNINGVFIDNYSTGIHVGNPSDTASTKLSTSSVMIQNCIADIIQEGLATLNFNVSSASQNKIVINDATNVSLAFFNLDNNNALTIGSTADQDTTLIQANTAPTAKPSISYKTSLYSTQGLGYENSNTNNSATWFVQSNNDAYVTGVTTSRGNISGLKLVSDEASPVGGESSLRGWNIEKKGSTAELAFSYENSDIAGQSTIAKYIVMQLDGLANQLQLPEAGTQIVFDTDTNLYRSSANVLKTDDNFIVGTLTPNRVVVTAPVTNQLASSGVTFSELTSLSGITSNVQTQLNSKVNKSGDSMTGALELPSGSPTTPSLRFAGNTGTGLSASTNLSLSTNGVERINVDQMGNVTINNLTPAGVVHNDGLGKLSSSLIVNNDISNATISTAKLATVSSANIPSNIVVRDGAGNFDAYMISLTGPVVNNSDVATKEYVDSTITLGLIAHIPARAVSTTNVPLNGLLTIDGVSLVANDRVLLTGQTNQTENGLWLAQAGSWIRPADFSSETQANQAYVLISSGTANTGSSWLINTPNAIIDTDPINFALFSLPEATTGANVGTGTGLVFKNKTGVTLNFRTLAGDSHTTIVSNPNEIVFTSDATNANSANTIVARDNAGNFSAETITANLTGAASLNVLKSGDTMTGNLVLPAGTVNFPSLTFTGSTTSGLSAIGDTLSFSNDGNETMNINSSGVITIDAFNTPGVVHNNASGNLSTSLIVNDDIDPSTSIDDNKLATIVTAGKVANSATTATSINTPNTIVARDGAGNINATTLIANVVGSSSNNVLKAGDTMTGTLQLPAGTTALPSLVFSGSTTTGLSTNSGSLSFSTNALERLKISSGGAISIDAFTTPGIIHNDSSGNLSSSLIVNSDIAAGAGIVDTKLATIATAGKIANSATTATASNTANAMVARDASGNFSAGTITANLTGNATTATTATNATNFTGSLVGDVTGTQGSTIVSSVGGQTAANVAASTVLTNAATSANTASALVKRSSSGGISVSEISVTDQVISDSLTIIPFDSAGIVHNDGSGLLSSSLIVNADIDLAAAIADTKLATLATAGKVANSATTATNLNTANTIIARDASGNFSAGTITANLSGNATTATTATNVSGSLSGDVTGTQSATVVATVGGQTAANVAAATVLANTSTTNNTASSIVRRDASGNFSAGAISITDGVISNSLSLAPLTTAGIVHNNASGLLSSSLIVNADISSSAAIADTKLATIATAGKVANSSTTATNLNTANTIIARDASGNFSAGTITANLSGNATTATTATNVSGSLSGDVTGTQNATVVATVGGQTAADIAAGSVLANTATSANTTSSIVRRDASGNFSAGAISITDGVISNSLSLAPLTTAGIVHNNASGLLSSSLIVNADVAAGAAIVDSKLATITTSGKVANSATTATSANTVNAIVARDASGNFSAGTITANLTGNATTATTATNATNFTGSLVGDVTGTQGATIVSTVGGQTAANVAASTVLANAATSANTASAIVRRSAAGGLSASSISVADEVISNSLIVSPFTAAGIVHNNASGLLSTSLIVNADIDSAAAIADSKLATISTAGKVANSATTATNLNTANTIIARDGSGNFSAGTITANLSGNATTATTATNVSGSLSGDVTGTQGATVVSTVGGQTAANVAAGSVLANAATSANTASAIVRRSAAGGLSASSISVADQVITNSLSLTPFTTAGVVHNNASGALSTSLIVNADVSSSAAIADTKLATISTAGKVANSATTATNLNTANTIVARDASGNFSAGTITANLNGNATTATTATNVSGSLVGDVTGTQGATVVATVGGQTAANVAAGSVLANAATSANTASAIVRRSAAGGLSASSISVADEVISNSLIVSPFTAAGIVHNNASGLLSTSLIVNADIDSAAAIADSKLATISTAGKIANSATTGTTSNVINTLVLRDGSGNFSTNMITIAGTVTNPTDVATKSYVDTAAGTGLASLVAHTPVTVVSTTNVGLLGGLLIDGVTLLTGNRVLLVGQTNPVNNGIWIAQLGSWTRPTDFANGTTAGRAYVLVTSGLVNAGTSWVCSTPNAVIGTDPLGFIQFSAPGSLLTANVGIGTGQLLASQVGNTVNLKSISAGSHISVTNNATDINVATDATNLNTAGTIIARDGLGNFAASVANLTDCILTGNLGLLPSASSTTGNILKGGTRFIHNFGINNTCVGINAGNFTSTGLGNNSCFGVNALTATTLGANNTALGYNTLPLCTIGNNNIALGVNAGSLLLSGSDNIHIGNIGASATESSTIRIGTPATHNKCFISGIRGVTTDTATGIAVIVDSNGQLGTISSSREVKHDIQDMGNASDNVLNLRPVTFAYNEDESERTQYGLIAEEVEEVFPALVVHGKDGQPETVQYHVLPVLLLNEIKKQKEELNNMDITFKDALNSLQHQLNEFVERIAVLENKA